MKSYSLIYGIFFLAFSMALAVPAISQNKDSIFNTFKKKMQNDISSFKKENDKKFRNFRSNSDSLYYNFLKQSWLQFNSLQPQIALVKPKPIKLIPPENVDHPVKSPVMIIIDPKPLPDSTATHENITPTKILNPKDEPASRKTIPASERSYTSIDFYGYSLKAPLSTAQKMPVLQGPVSNTTIATFWADASKCEIGSWLSFINETEILVGGGSYALYQELLKSMSVYYNGNKTNAKLFTWYLLMQKGYDVKVAYRDAEVFLLMNAKPDIFGKSYFSINNKPYFMLDESNGKSLSICPNDFKLTSNICNLELTPALVKSDITKRKYSFTFLSKKYELELAYSEKQIEYFKYYPQLSYSNYNVSEQGEWFDKQVRETFEPVLADFNTQKKVQFLLSFVQSAFAYKTDTDQFGREKWFFPQETLFYPYSDCDDRAILFSYLVKKLVRLPVIGLLYPDHICTAVAFSEEIDGTIISYKGKKYVLCDPTYTNSQIGMCMPNYIGKQPIIFE